MNWDVIVVGAGIIGLSLALELRRNGAEVLVIERGEPGREASWAAGGMIAYCDPQLDARLLPLAHASAKLYPQWVNELEDESETKVDFQNNGTILLLRRDEKPHIQGTPLDAEQLRALEPGFEAPASNAYLVPEPWIDPRLATTAALHTARRRGVHVVTGAEVLGVLLDGKAVAGVRTERTQYHAAAVVNCAGAWAKEIDAPYVPPTRPAKGHMLAVAAIDPHGGPHRPLLTHVIRHPASVYLIPRGDGRIVIGSTLEPAGYDKRVLPAVIQRLHQLAADLVPVVGQARMLESWTGLRPGTPDNLPIMGATQTPGYYVCTGHYRDGFLLAPITARLLAAVVAGQRVEYDLAPFAPARFH